MIPTLRHLILGAVLTVNAFCQSDPPPIEWQKTYGAGAGDFLKVVQEAGSGGFVLGGSSDGSTNQTKTSEGFGGIDYWVVRTDASGERLWDQSFGGTRQDFLQDLSLTADGGLILAGYSNSDTNGNKSSPMHGSGIFDLGDFWLVRLDSDGNELWDRSYGGSDDDVLFAVHQTTDGGYVCGGFSASPPSGNKTASNHGSSDFWVVRTDETGDVIWDRSYGGDANDILYALQQTADGGFIVGGVTLSGLSGNKTSPSFGGEDIWIIRLDSDGDKVWEASFGGTGRDGLYSLEQLADGGFILGGYSSSTNNSGNKTSPNHGVADFWIIRLDSAGQKVREQSYGGSKDDQLLVLRQTADGGFLAGGYSYSPADGNKTSPNFSTNGDFWLLRLDSDGDKTWEQVYGGTSLDRLESFGFTMDGGLVLGGESSSGISGNKTSPAYGQQDYWIIKLASIAPTAPPLLRTVPQTFGQVQSVGFRMFLEGSPNATYAVDYQESVGVWVPLETNTLSATEIEIIDPGAAGSSKRLYRARVAD